MNKSYLKKIYRYNEENQTFVAEISLEYYLELFNPWDAASIKKKDLDPELVSYLEDVSDDIPLKEKLAIVFVMPKQVQNEEMENISRGVFVEYFNFLIHYNRKTQRKSLKQAIYYIITSFTFVALAYFLRIDDTMFIEILSEGLFIGGWVFMWEAISIIFFKSSFIRRQSKRYQRLSNSYITYEYK
ncbi:MAG: hypothetical protein RBQ97_09510 [Acholeplasma sp.]|jgi:hypothetical protein|nr:hypothetical protein [Acholeplasma sp.]